MPIATGSVIANAIGITKELCLSFHACGNSEDPNMLVLLEEDGDVIVLDFDDVEGQLIWINGRESLVDGFTLGAFDPCHGGLGGSVISGDIGGNGSIGNAIAGVVVVVFCVHVG